MRCLLVCASPQAGPPAWISSLAAENDCVIAVDGGGVRCLEAGVVPDVLVGDADSLTAEQLAGLREREIPWISSPADKDDSDLALALAHARVLGATAVTVTGAWGGRADHSLAVLAALVGAADLRPRMLEPSASLWVLTPAARRLLRLSGSGATLSLLPFGGEAVVSIEGVKWPLAEKTIEPTSTLGLSNVIANTDTANVSVSRGRLVVISECVNSVPQAIEI